MVGGHIGLGWVAGAIKKSVSTTCQYTVSWSSRPPDDSITLCAVGQNLSYDPNSLYECFGSGMSKGRLPEKHPTTSARRWACLSKRWVDPGK
jgi:hypothetical protein